MITSDHRDFILACAYVPEHSVGLMTRVSGAEPFLIDDYFCCADRDRAIVVGYPLEHEFSAIDLEGLVRKVIRSFRPRRVSLVAPEIPRSIAGSCSERGSDRYYVLDLCRANCGSGLKAAVRKARERVVTERANQLSGAHRGLVAEFAGRVDLPARVRELLFKMWEFVGRVEDSLVLNAWSPTGELAAFFVVDMAPREFSTYVIGAHSKRSYTPHASDVLMSEMIEVSMESHKKYIHLGLGVNDGLRRFKTKWGGIPSLPYEMCEMSVRGPSMLKSIVNFARK